MSDCPKTTLRELIEDAVPILDAVLAEREETIDEADEILRDLLARMREALANG